MNRRSLCRDYLIVAACLAILSSFAEFVPGAEATGRTLQYSQRSRSEAQAWQRNLRSKLFEILKLDDLAARTKPAPLQASEISALEKEGYRITEVEITSMAGRRIRCLVTRPQPYSGLCPAVVCIHGHGGKRHTVYDTASGYYRFATTLAQRGYVTISTDVGQHTLQDSNGDIQEGVTIEENEVLYVFNAKHPLPPHAKKTNDEAAW